MPRATARKPPLHVVFGDSTAGSLMRALRILPSSRKKQIANLQAHLHVGPIAPADARARARWSREELVFFQPPSIGRINAFWRAVVAADDLVVWMSSRCARELCGFMELVWRRRRPVRVVDVSTLRLPRSDGYLKRTMSRWMPQRIVEHRLLDRARLVDLDEVEAIARAWEQIAAERTQLRIAARGGPLSVLLSHFDDALVAGIGSEWQRCVHVIFNMIEVDHAIRYSQVDEAFLHWRLLWLIDAGVLEGQGDFGSFLTCSVRRVTL